MSALLRLLPQLLAVSAFVVGMVVVAALAA